MRKDLTGTGTITSGTHVELYWGSKYFKCTVPLNDSNIAIFWSTPGTKRFSALVAKIDEPVSITDDEDKEDTDTDPHEANQSESTERTNEDSNNDQEVVNTRNSPLEVNFFDEDGLAEQTRMSTLTSLHCWLAHASFARLKSMAKCGLIPSKLANVPPPMCASCQHG
jgi:hypothetical protein